MLLLLFSSICLFQGVWHFNLEFPPQLSHPASLQCENLSLTLHFKSVFFWLIKDAVTVWCSKSKQFNDTTHPWKLNNSCSEFVSSLPLYFSFKSFFHKKPPQCTIHWRNKLLLTFTVFVALKAGAEIGRLSFLKKKGGKLSFSKISF